MCLLEVARAPVLNDVSTDLDDPPAYLVAQRKPLPEAWKPRIRAAYPDLRPLTVQLSPAPTAPSASSEAATAAPSPSPSPAALLDAVIAVARAMPRWQVQKVVGGAEPGPEAAAGAGSGPGSDAVVEAVATTALFKFRDDVVVRLRRVAAGGQEGLKGQGPAGAEVWRVDVRSSSRVGKGDLGANAARIGVFMARLRQELALRGMEGQ